MLNVKDDLHLALKRNQKCFKLECDKGRPLVLSSLTHLWFRFPTFPTLARICTGMAIKALNSSGMLLRCSKLFGKYQPRRSVTQTKVVKIVFLLQIPKI